MGGRGGIGTIARLVCTLQISLICNILYLNIQLALEKLDSAFNIEVVNENRRCNISLTDIVFIFIQH